MEANLNQLFINNKNSCQNQARVFVVNVFTLECCFLPLAKLYLQQEIIFAVIIQGTKQSAM